MTYREQITDCLKEWGLPKVEYKISTTLYNLTKNKGIDKILKGILVNENQSLFVFEQIAKANFKSMSNEKTCCCIIHFVTCSCYIV